MNIAQSTGLKLGLSVVIRGYPSAETALVSIFANRICLEMVSKVGLETSSSANELRIIAKVCMLNLSARLIDYLRSTSRQS